jgi:hypothetical protein
METKPTSVHIGRWIIIAVVGVVVFKFFSLMVLIYFGAGFATGAVFTKAK